MATNTPDNSLQQQQAAQQAQQIRQASKQALAHDPPAVQFSQVMQTQLAAKNPTTIALLQKKNPVAGAAVVKAAISSSGTKSKLGTTANTQAPNTGTTTSTSTGTSTSDPVIQATTGGASSTSGAQGLMQATAHLQEVNQDFNLQYLNLQENQQAESRQYTALSNVSKTKSDTAKNSLTNVK